MRASTETVIMGRYRSGDTGPVVIRLATRIYADALVEIVTDALEAEPDRFASCASWSDLHDVCDANDFLVAADDALAIDTDPSSAAYCDVVNAAVPIAEAQLFAR